VCAIAPVLFLFPWFARHRAGGGRPSGLFFYHLLAVPSLGSAFLTSGYVRLFNTQFSSPFSLPRFCPFLLTFLVLTPPCRPVSMMTACAVLETSFGRCTQLPSNSCISVPHSPPHFFPVLLCEPCYMLKCGPLFAPLFNPLPFPFARTELPLTEPFTHLFLTPAAPFFLLFSGRVIVFLFYGLTSAFPPV